MTTILTLILLIGAFLVGMNIWTRKLTRDGLKRVPQMGEVVPVNGGSIHYVERDTVMAPARITNVSLVADVEMRCRCPRHARRVRLHGIIPEGRPSN